MRSSYPIAVVVGSLRQESFNGKLPNALARLAPPEFKLIQLEMGDLPLYNQDDDSHPAPGVIGVSLGATGTALAQQHLRNTLAYLNLPTLGQPEAFLQAKDGLFASDGGMGPDSLVFVQKWMDPYVDWVKLHAG